ncbi:MAG: DUF3302 domain-containing protein [Acidobacteria bacterium]|nr:DUF3302 domain-containing protein [Acidobacteriota bacterium]
MLGFTLEPWDYLALGAMMLLVTAGLFLGILVLGLPGRIALARKHPDAEAVKMMGYLGFLAIIPWFHAFIWAFKPTDVIDIRRFPREEQKAIQENLDRLKGDIPPGRTHPGEAAE